MNGSYYAVIPAKVLHDKDLLKYPKSILLYGHIANLANQKGYCWATNKYFMEQLGVKSATTITDYLNLLVHKGFIKKKKIYKDGTKQIEKRIISIDTGTPIPPDCNTSTPADCNSPIPPDCKENNTSINNTSTNKLGFYVINFYENNVGMIGPWIREDIEYEVQEWHKINADEAEKIIVEALKNAIGSQARNKWKYAKSILNSWKERNIHSLSDIEADDKQHQRETQARYDRRNYGRKTIEEKIPEWNKTEQHESDNHDTSDIADLMAKVNKKTAANKDGVKSKEE